MVRATCALVFAAVFIAGPALAADPVMGNWQGTFTAGPWQGQPLSAKVIGEGGDTYRVVLVGGSEKEPWPKMELAGQRVEQCAAFVGKGDVGKERGGLFVVTAESEGPKMTGRFLGMNRSAEFALEKVAIQSPTLGAPPPAGAVVLFSGDNLDAWQPVPDHIRDGAMLVVASRSFVSKEEFGDCKMHVEFQTPYMPEERGQGRGNSGVYVQGRYEVQVLDSFGDDPADNLCGGIYKIAAPRVSACLPPEQWQTYDITFRAPGFDQSGKKTQDAEITVLQNGVLIHDGLKLPHVTPGGVSDQEGKTGPLFLQDHGNAVRYRNIWVLPLK